MDIENNVRKLIKIDKARTFLDAEWENKVGILENFIKTLPEPYSIIESRAKVDFKDFSYSKYSKEFFARNGSKNGNGSINNITERENTQEVIVNFEEYRHGEDEYWSVCYPLELFTTSDPIAFYRDYIHKEYDLLLFKYQAEIKADKIKQDEEIKKKLDEALNIVEEGKNTFLDGKTLVDCPYKQDTSKSIHWTLGFLSVNSEKRII